MKKAKKRLIITSLLITILIVSFLFSGCSNVSKYAKPKSEKASGECYFEKLSRRLLENSD